MLKDLLCHLDLSGILVGMVCDVCVIRVKLSTYVDFKFPVFEGVSTSFFSALT